MNSHKPCPFCAGSTYEIVQDEHPNGKTIYAVMCECNAFGPNGPSPAAAWHLWDCRRASVQ